MAAGLLLFGAVSILSPSYMSPIMAGESRKRRVPENATLQLSCSLLTRTTTFGGGGGVHLHYHNHSAISGLSASGPHSLGSIAKPPFNSSVDPEASSYLGN